MGLVAQTVTYVGYPWYPAKETTNIIAAGVAVVITGYFWWRNTRGLRESSGDALKIMYVTTVMVVLLIVWSGVTMLTRPDTQRLPGHRPDLASGFQCGCRRLAAEDRPAGMLGCRP